MTHPGMDAPLRSCSLFAVLVLGAGRYSGPCDSPAYGFRVPLHGVQVGLVRQCADGIVYTIEGNKSGFPAPVRQYDYVLGRIDRLLGFGHVPF